MLMPRSHLHVKPSRNNHVRQFSWNRIECDYSVSKKKEKGNPGLTQNFSNSKKDITKLISVHNSIIIVLSFWYIVYSYLAMDGCTAINFVKQVKLFLFKLALFALHDGICGSFHNIWSNKAKLGRRQFWHALQNWLLSSHPWLSMNDQCTIMKER